MQAVISLTLLEVKSKPLNGSLTYTDPNTGNLPENNKLLLLRPVMADQFLSSSVKPLLSTGTFYEYCFRTSNQ